jgi:hypothetical protein
MPTITGSRYSRHPPSSCSVVIGEIGLDLGGDDVERSFSADRPDAAQ